MYKDAFGRVYIELIWAYENKFMWIVYENNLSSSYKLILIHYNKLVRETCENKTLNKLFTQTHPKLRMPAVLMFHYVNNFSWILIWTYVMYLR